MSGGPLGYLPFPIATEFISSAVSASLLSSAKYNPPKRECLPEVVAMAAACKIQWREGYMAMAAVGATNIGSIELFIEPRLRTNHPHKKLLYSELPDERVCDPESMGVILKKGDEFLEMLCVMADESSYPYFKLIINCSFLKLAAFDMGSTLVLVFQAPNSQYSTDTDFSSDFKFLHQEGRQDPHE